MIDAQLTDLGDVGHNLESKLGGHLVRSGLHEFRINELVKLVDEASHYHFTDNVLIHQVRQEGNYV